MLSEGHNLKICCDLFLFTSFDDVRETEDVNQASLNIFVTSIRKYKVLTYGGMSYSLGLIFPLNAFRYEFRVCQQIAIPLHQSHVSTNGLLDMNLLLYILPRFLYLSWALMKHLTSF